MNYPRAMSAKCCEKNYAAKPLNQHYLPLSA
jgi:hypothetical protein